MKNILALAICLLAGSAFADTTSKAGPDTQNTKVNTASNAQASVATGAVAVTFTSPSDTTSTATVNQNISGTQTVNNNQTVSGGTNSSERIDYGTQIIRNTPSVSGPPLVSSNDTCMGSASGGVNGPGFGISLGKTYTDANCVMLKNARELWNMGMKAASMARMCMDAENREALEMTGFVCPQTRKARGENVYAAGQTSTTLTVEQASPQPADSSVYTGNDPIVRKRLGLPVKE